MQLRGILFDFDGTLADSIELIMAAFRHTFSVCLHRELPRSAIVQTFGLPLRQALARYAASAEQLEEMRSVFRAFTDRNHDAMIKCLPGAAEALAALQNMGIRMAVVTSKKKPRAYQGLRCCGLERYIDAVVGCDEVAHAKPHPEPMLAGCALLGLEPRACLCVGDSPYDLQSGRRAGCATAAVRYTAFDWASMLAAAQPDYVINRLTELPALIQRINHAEEAGDNA